MIVHCAAWTAVDAAEDEDKKDSVYNQRHRAFHGFAHEEASQDIEGHEGACQQAATEVGTSVVAVNLAFISVEDGHLKVYSLQIGVI